MYRVVGRAGTVQAEIAAGAVDVLLIPPERLNNPSLRDEVLLRPAATVGLLVADEAHSVSDRSDGAHASVSWTPSIAVLPVRMLAKTCSVTDSAPLPAVAVLRQRPSTGAAYKRGSSLIYALALASPAAGPSLSRVILGACLPHR